MDQWFSLDKTRSLSGPGKCVRLELLHLTLEYPLWPLYQSAAGFTHHVRGSNNLDNWSWRKSNAIYILLESYKYTYLYHFCLHYPPISAAVMVSWYLVVVVMFWHLWGYIMGKGAPGKSILNRICPNREWTFT